MEWYLKALKQYATFSGRASRKEFWMFTLFDIIFVIVLHIFDESSGISLIKIPISVYYSCGIFIIAYAVFTFIPRWAVTVRRMHDIGLSGWGIIIYVLLSLAVTLSTMGGEIIALINCIGLLILMAPSNPHTNKYGDNPKYKSKDA